MKKLNKKVISSLKTVEKFACNCGCGCLLWFNNSTTATSAKSKAK